MSQVKIEIIECPHCHKKGEIKLWDSVNVSLDPELREKVLSGELWKWTCPLCGHETYIPWGTIYHDMENRFMLFFDFDEEGVENKYAPLELPTEIGNMEGYTFRSVYGYDNLKEKIHVFENHLNDVAIERLRYIFTHIMHPELAENGNRLYFHFLEHKANEQSEYGSIHFIFFTDEEGDESMKGYRLPMDWYYEHELAVKNDPRMILGSNKCVDEEWMKRQLSKTK